MWGAEWNLFENLAKIDEDDDGSIFYESGRHMTMRTSLLSVFKQLTWLAILVGKPAASPTQTWGGHPDARGARH